MRPHRTLVLVKSDRDYGWAVVVPFGTIEKMIGEKHFLMLSSRIEYLRFFQTQPLEMCANVLFVSLKIMLWEKKKNLKRWLLFIHMQPELTLAVNPTGCPLVRQKRM